MGGKENDDIKKKAFTCVLSLALQNFTNSNPVGEQGSVDVHGMYVYVPFKEHPIINYNKVFLWGHRYSYRRGILRYSFYWIG